MNGFDEIISTLDGHLKPEPALPEAPPARRPKFQVGDVVRMRETRWPPETGRVILKTGLYRDPGYPKIPATLRYAQQADEIEDFKLELHDALQERLLGTLKLHETCKVLSVWCDESDDKWYYFLDNGRPNGRGWTRCSYRLELTDGTHVRQR